MNPLIVLFGLGVGVLVGLTGMGGGSLMTPILILIFGYNPVTAVGTDLAYGAVTRTVGGWQHLRQRTVHLGVSAWMAVGSVPSAVGGVYVLHVLERDYGKSFDHAMLIAVAVALALTGGATLIRALFFPGAVARERSDFKMRGRHKLTAIVLGALVGFMLGMTSAGSGSLIAVGLIILFRLVPRRVVGTDVFHAAILLWAAAIAHVVAGNVDFGLAGTILIGSVPGVWVGSRLAVTIPTGTLRLALAIVLVGSSFGLLSKAGTGIPTPLIAAVPVLLAIVVGWQQLAARPRQKRRAKRALAGTLPQLER